MENAELTQLHQIITKLESITVIHFKLHFKIQRDKELKLLASTLEDLVLKIWMFQNIALATFGFARFGITLKLFISSVGTSKKMKYNSGKHKKKLELDTRAKRQVRTELSFALKCSLWFWTKICNSYTYSARWWIEQHRSSVKLPKSWYL